MTLPITATWTAIARWPERSTLITEGNMTPKEEYEARKAERAKLKDLEFNVRQRTESVMMLDTFDRFVTAVERIADSLAGIEMNSRPRP